MSSAWRTHRAQTAVVAGIAGLGLRLYVLASGLRATDSDEAVMALIGLHAGRGTFDAMFWGQAYGGTIEGLLAAPLFRVFGPSVLVERLLLFALAGVAALLTWRIGRRLVGEAGGVLAGGLFWTTSCYFVWWSTKLNIYVGALCLALAVVLLLLRLRDDEVPRWWPVAFGLAAGAAVWSNPQTVFLLVPAGLVNVRPLVRNLKQVAVSIPFAVIGAAPWLAFSVRNDWRTLQVPGVDVYLPYSERVLLFFKQLPIALGARQPMNDRWIVPWPAFAAAAIVLAAALAIAAVRNVRGVRVVIAVVAGYALLYGVSPQGGQPGASLQPRYLLFVTPFLAIAIAALLGRSVLAGVVALTLTATLTAIGLHAMDAGHTTRLVAAAGAAVPEDIGDLTSLLRSRHIRHAYSFYWVAYRTTFETGEHTIVDPSHWHVSRYRPYADAVRTAPEPAAVIVQAGTPQVDAMRRLFEGKGIAYEVHQKGGWAVIEPAAKVDREEVAAAFRSVGILA